MKPYLLKLVVLGALTLMIACAFKSVIVPKPAEIDEYLQSHADLPEVDKLCIGDSRFDVGMMQESVFFLLGKPDKVEVVKQPWAVQEMWTYNKIKKKTFIMEDKHVVGILDQ